MALSRQHYEQVASILATNINDCDARGNTAGAQAGLQIAHDLARYFAGDNPAFVVNRFMDAIAKLRKPGKFKNPGGRGLVLKLGNIYEAKDFPRGLIADMSRPGPVDAAATRWVNSGMVRVDDKNAMRIFLKEEGGWNDRELQVYEHNLARLLWIAVMDIKENGEWYFGK